MPALKNARKTILESANSAFPVQSSETEIDAFATSAKSRQKCLHVWNSHIDQKLIEWGLHPEHFDDEDLDPPSAEAIGKACQVAIWMRNSGLSFPTGIIPDGEGGIAFENRNDPVYESIEVDKDGVVYYVSYLDCKFQSRDRLEIE